MREENRNEKLHDALNFLDDSFIEDVEKLRGQIIEEKMADKEYGMSAEYTRISIFESRRENIEEKKKYTWKKWTALAASICLVISCGWLTWSAIQRENHDVGEESISGNFATGGVVSGQEDSVDTNEIPQGVDYVEVESDTDGTYYALLTLGQLLAKGYDTAGKDATDKPLKDLYTGDSLEVSEEIMGITIPAKELDAEILEGKNDDIAYDMEAFFIYEGRWYVQNELIENGENIVGAYTGTASGSINEWTTESEYVEGSGSIGGRFYEVKGIAPEFMLCMILDNGVVETYINDNGITLVSGADVVEDRIHLIDNFKEVSFFTHEQWKEFYTGKQQATRIAEEKHELMKQFLEAYADARFMYLKDTSLAKEMTYNSDAIYHLYFTTTEGVTVSFWVLENGYVVFDGLDNVCVQIEAQVYSELVQMLEEIR